MKGRILQQHILMWTPHIRCIELWQHPQMYIRYPINDILMYEAWRNAFQTNKMDPKSVFNDRQHNDRAWGTNYWIANKVLNLVHIMNNLINKHRQSSSKHYVLNKANSPTYNLIAYFFLTYPSLSRLISKGMSARRFSIHYK